MAQNIAAFTLDFLMKGFSLSASDGTKFGMDEEMNVCVMVFGNPIKDPKQIVQYIPVRMEVKDFIKFCTATVTPHHVVQMERLMEEYEKGVKFNA